MDTLSGMAGMLLSLAVSYIPGLKEKFAALDSTQKRLVMALLIIAVAVSPVAASCVSALRGGASCDTSTLASIVNNILSALVANQATYMIAPQPQAKAA